LKKGQSFDLCIHGFYITFHPHQYQRTDPNGTSLSGSITEINPWI
jgi:hypothetical protein